MPATRDWNSIQRQVRRLLRQYHPDVHQDNKLYYEERTRSILHAYEKLREHFAKGAPLPEIPEPPPPPTALPLSFLSFSISHRQFAFPIATVCEVCEGKHLQPTSLFLGRMSTRYGQVPVFSLAHLCQIPPLQQSLDPDLSNYLYKIILVKKEEQVAGFFVEQVHGIQELKPEDLLATPTLPSLQSILLGVAVKDQQILLILSPEKIFQKL